MPALRSLANDGGSRTTWLVIAAIVVAIVLALLAMPLSEAITRTREDVARNRLVLDIAQRRTAENATLARATAPARAADARGAIDRVLAAEGLHYQRAATQGDDGSTSIVIAEADFDALVRALDRLAREESIEVADAVITARVEPGRVRAELALRR